MFLIFLLVSCASASHEPIFREDYSYSQVIDGWVKMHRIPANWNDARLRCRAEGASLVSPINFNMQYIMESFMIALSADPGLGIYTGIHSTFSYGSYSTIEGVPVSALPVSWVPGQPDHVYEENCVIFHLNGTSEDVNCSNAFEFICYKKYEELALNECNTVDNKYKLDNRTGHCYKFHPVGETWPRAHMTCIAEGGYLAIINSDTEADILRELLVEYPKRKIISTLNDVAMIGFREWPEELSWYTIHGQTLEEAGYNKWCEGQPDGNIYRGETQHCGGIYKNGLLDDLWCLRKIAFICEKDLEASQ